MKKELEKLIKNYVVDYQKKDKIKSEWKEPVIKYADAADPLFDKLKEAVSEDHLLPEDILPGARTVIAYFIPFSEQTS